MKQAKRIFGKKVMILISLMWLSGCMATNAIHQARKSYFDNLRLHQNGFREVRQVKLHPNGDIDLCMVGNQLKTNDAFTVFIKKTLTDGAILEGDILKPGCDLALHDGDVEMRLLAQRDADKPSNNQTRWPVHGTQWREPGMPLEFLHYNEKGDRTAELDIHYVWRLSDAPFPDGSLVTHVAYFNAEQYRINMAAADRALLSSRRIVSTSSNTDPGSSIEIGIPLDGPKETVKKVSEWRRFFFRPDIPGYFHHPDHAYELPGNIIDVITFPIQLPICLIFQVGFCGDPHPHLGPIVPG